MTYASARMRVTATAAVAPLVLGRLRLRPALAAPLLFGCVALVLTTIGAWIPSASTDEAATASAIERSLPDLVRMTTTGVDAVHALYYVVLQAWSRVFGMELVSLRIFSALGVGVGAAGTVRLGHLVGGLRFGVLAGAVFITVPMTTWAATEARSYAWLIAVTTWASVALLVALRRGGWFWAAYGVVVLIACALFIYSALVIATHVFAILFLAPSMRRRLAGIAAAGVGVLAASPVLLLSYRQRSQVSWIGPFTTDMARSAALQWFGESQPFATIAWLLVLVAVVAAVRRRRRAPDVAAAERAQAGLMLVLLLPWALLPTVLLLAATAAGQPLYVSRYSAISLGALALLLAYGVSVLRYRATISVALLAALAMPTWIAQRLPLANGTDWQTSAAVVAKWARPGDAIYFAQTGAAASPRLMLPVYRSEFADLDDVALWGTAAKVGGLTDSVAPASDAVRQISSTQDVIVVADNAAPWWHSTDADTFEQFGFTVVRSVENATTSVILLRKR